MSDAPTRIQLSQAKGYRKPLGAISVGRPGPYGNRFRVGDRVALLDEAGTKTWIEVTITPELAVALFRAWIEAEEQDEFRATAIAALRWHDLACWCAPGAPCHGDVWIEISNLAVAA